MNDPVDIHQIHPRPSLLRQFFAADLTPKLKPPEVGYPDPPPPSPGVARSGRGFDLAIDFGTSAIAVALVGGRVGCKVLLFDDQPLLEAPLGRRSDLGRSALAENYELNFVPSYLSPAPGEPVWEYFPCLKRRIEWLARCGAGTAWQREAVLDVAAVCRVALDKARDDGGQPLGELLSDAFRVYFTVPNTFPRAAIEVLARGVGYGVAAALGTRRVPPVRALLEAEAVAYGVLARRSPIGTPPADATVLVVDAGAGTTDASIVRAHKDSLRVLAHVGLPVGGMDLDALASRLRGPLEGLHPSELSQRLVTSREAKQLHLGASPAASGPAATTLEERFEAMVAALEPYGWPVAARDAEGRSMEQRLARGYERYMALAVRSLLFSLPEDELRSVDRVVLSGRGSLLAGFPERVQETLAEKGVRLEPRAAASGEQRKLAVVEGVGAFAASTFSPQWDRRPVRASFEIVLLHSGRSELQLVAAGHPLVDGWGVEAWHHPLPETGKRRARLAVEMRMIPHRVLEQLGGSFSGEELRQLIRWSAMPALRLEDEIAPFSARFAFDYLTLRALLEVDGRPIRVEEEPAIFGRHPVHDLPENWFERFHRGAGA